MIKSAKDPDRANNSKNQARKEESIQIFRLSLIYKMTLVRVSLVFLKVGKLLPKLFIIKLFLLNKAVKMTKKW